MTILGVGGEEARAVDVTKSIDEPPACPFCASDDVVNWLSHDAAPNVWAVFCQTCGAEGPHSADENQAIELWARRPGDTADTDMLAALQEIDRLSPAIVCAIRNDDTKRLDLVIAAILATRAAIAKARGNAMSRSGVEARAIATEIVDRWSRGEGPLHEAITSAILSAESRARPQWQPIDSCALKRKGRVLVTNNLHAIDAHGIMSHVWIGHIIKSDDPKKSGKYVTFDESDRLIHNITHWQPLPLDPLAQTRGEGK